MTALVLHKGAELVDYEQVRSVKTPQPRGRWYPLPHDLVVDRVRETIESTGLAIAREEHGLYADGSKYFGLFDLAGGEDRGAAVGIRNSHDKSWSAGLVVGNRVFVCDNLSFSGEVRVDRKHTRHIKRDLDRLIAEAFGRLVQARQRMDDRIAAYKAFRISGAMHAHIMVQAARSQVVPWSRLKEIDAEYRKPRHECFEPAVAWSLFNAFTANMKHYRLADQSRRTIRLYGLFDGALGLTSVG